MPEIPVTDAIITEPEKGTGEDGYSVEKAESLAHWVTGLVDDAASARREKTRESKWESDWDFLARQKQWDGPLPSYRRPIVVNVWRRAYHIVVATLFGNRPILKLVPQGVLDPKVFQTWQSALWGTMKTQNVIDEYCDAWSWGAVADGGWLKVGYGRPGDMPMELPDVLVKSVHPAKVYPDPECTDPTLAACSHIVFRDVLDLGTIGRRYPEQGWRVTPDSHVSMKWDRETSPAWVNATGSTIAPAGGWSTSGTYRRARATVNECWIDDPSLEGTTAKMVVNLDKLFQALAAQMEFPNGDALSGVLKSLRETPSWGTFQMALPMLGTRFPNVEFTPEVREQTTWAYKYPYGRVITSTAEVILRDIPNPFGTAFGYARRWPFVFVAGAKQPHALWRPGLLSDLSELQRAINKSLSLLLENEIKVTNAMVIADDTAMDDEDWDLLSLVPGVKIRKRPGTEVKIQFPDPLPEHAFRFPDYMIRKLEEVVGIHDPPIAPGQAVAAKTVQFLQQKGSFLLGILAQLGDEALERLGMRMVGLMRERYLPNRMIPLFEGERVSAMAPLPELPPALQLRVEASSGFAEVLATMQQAAQVEAQSRRTSKK